MCLPNLTFHFKKNIMLPLLVSAISIIKIIVFMNFFCYCSWYSPKYYRKNYTAEMFSNSIMFIVFVISTIF